MHCYIITVSYFIHKVGNTTIFIYSFLKFVCKIIMVQPTTLRLRSFKSDIVFNSTDLSSIKKSKGIIST